MDGSKGYENAGKIRDDVVGLANEAAKRHDFDTLRLIRRRLALGPGINRVQELECPTYRILTGFAKDLDALWGYLKEGARLPPDEQVQERLRATLAHLIEDMQHRGRRMMQREETVMCVTPEDLGWSTEEVTLHRFHLAADACGLERCDPDVVAMAILNDVPYDATFLTGVLEHDELLRSARGSLVDERPMLTLEHTTGNLRPRAKVLCQRKK